VARYLKRGEPQQEADLGEIRETVSRMLLDIERRGLDAMREYSRRLDDWDPPSFVVRADEIEAASAEISDELERHIAFAQSQIRTFAEAQRDCLLDLKVSTLKGVELGHRHIPVDAVGAYAPGGRYPMLASAFMTVLVPKVAGVPRVVACAPPRKGQGIHPTQLHAMATSGADQILCLGGVQALGAMAFGIEDVEPTDMLVGPGNAYVAEAKRQLFGRVGIDLLAGPSEILIVADESADPEIVAADLLGQAEHGLTSPAVLIATSEATAREVAEHIRRLLETWPTAAVAGEAWERFGEIAVVDGHQEAIALANVYAFEHLEVQVDEAEEEAYLEGLRNYGSLFLGANATVAYGDKAVGTNHVLPTGRAARYTGGLWVGKFLKTVTFQRLTDAGTEQVAPAVAAISEAEFFGGHALTATMRLDRLAGNLG
jgi:sulfopropanediol 3-dehydrogenase